MHVWIFLNLANGGTGHSQVIRIERDGLVCANTRTHTQLYTKLSRQHLYTTTVIISSSGSNNISSNYTQWKNIINSPVSLLFYSIRE